MEILSVLYNVGGLIWAEVVLGNVTRRGMLGKRNIEGGEGHRGAGDGGRNRCGIGKADMSISC